MICNFPEVLNFQSFGLRRPSNYRMMVDRYPNSKEEVGGSNPDCEMSSLFDIKCARWSTASCALALDYRPSISKNTNKDKNSIACSQT